MKCAEGEGQLSEETKEHIMEYARSVLDNDRQKKLLEELGALARGEVETAASLFKVIKELVVSPVEKGYINKIEKELKEDERLEQEIREAEDSLQNEKNKKLAEYETQKSGLGHSSCKSLKSAQKEAENFENKLMRANQKLNQLSSRRTEEPWRPRGTWVGAATARPARSGVKRQVSRPASSAPKS